MIIRWVKKEGGISEDSRKAKKLFLSEGDFFLTCMISSLEWSLHIHCIVKGNDL